MSSEDTNEDGPEEGGYRRFPRSYFAPKPIKTGDEVDVDISEVSRKGDGVARIEGYVIFVPNTKQGERKRIRIAQIRPNFAIGEVIGEASGPAPVEGKPSEKT